MKNYYKPVKLSKNQSIIIRRFLKYLGFSVFEFMNSNLTISLHSSHDVTGTSRDANHYSFNEFMKELYERKRTK